MEKVKKELDFLETQLNKFGASWNITGVIDRMKASVKKAKQELNKL